MIRLFPTSDPASAAQGLCYSVFLDNPTLSATTEIPLLLLLNPSTSTKALQIFLRRLFMNNANSAQVRFYATPTVSANGTPVVPAPVKIGGPASVATPFTGPTISANGTLIDSLFSANSGQPDTAPFPLILQPNTSLLATIKASSTTSPLGFQVAWVEA